MYCFVAKENSGSWSVFNCHVSLVSFNLERFLSLCFCRTLTFLKSPGQLFCCCYCWVAKSCPTLPSRGLQLARHPCPSLSPGVWSVSCPLSQWYYLTISSSVVLFSFRLRSFPISGSFPWVSFSHQVAKVLELQHQHQSFQWFPSEWTGWISLQSKGLSRVFSNTTVQKHQFFGAQLSL